MHAGALEASTDGHLAAGLDHAGGNAQPLGAELGLMADWLGLEQVEGN